MSNIPITTGTGQASVASDLISTINYQQIKVVDGTIGSTTPLKVNADGSITASIYGNISTQGSIAAVIIGGSILTSSTANQSVSGTITASIAGAVAVYYATAATTAGGDGSPLLTIPISPSVSSTNPTGTGNYVYNGSGWDRLRGTIAAGALMTPYQLPSSLISGVTSVITGTTSVQVLAPAAAAQRNYITNLLVTNAAAVGTTVQLFDGGNVIYTGYAAASGGGFAVSFPAPLKQSSIAGNLSALTTVQASVFVSASGYTAA